MGQIRVPGNPPIDVVMRRSARARRLSLRLSQLDGRVTLTLPKNVPLEQGEAFVKSKADWLRGHLDKLDATVAVGFGTQIPIEGITHTIAPVSRRFRSTRVTRHFLIGSGRKRPPELVAILRPVVRTPLRRKRSVTASQ